MKIHVSHSRRVEVQARALKYDLYRDIYNNYNDGKTHYRVAPF